MKRKLMLGNNKTDKNTRLLVHFDNGFKDEITGNTLATFGSPSLNSDSKYGSKAGYFTFSSGLIIDKAVLSQILNSGNYTIEAWGKSVITGGDGYIVITGVDNGTYDGFTYRVTTVPPTCHYGVLKLISSIPFAMNGGYNHYAVVAKGGVVSFYVNGIKYGNSGSVNIIFPANTEATIGGRKLSITESSKDAWLLDEIRISDIPRWTSNFTPTTKPY